MDNKYVYNIVAKCFVLFDISPLDFLNPFNFHFNFILYQFIEVPLSFSYADGEAAAGCHAQFEGGLGGDFLVGDGVGVWVVCVVGEAGGIFAVAVDDGIVGFAFLKEVEFDGDFAGILISDAAYVPHIVQGGSG